MKIFSAFLSIALALSASVESHGHGLKKESKGHKKHVEGIVFDRFVTIWLENTNFAGAVADPSFAALTAQGIQLTNYFGVTHPSEPNYIASVGGDYFGMQNDNLNHVPANVSTIVDLLEHRGITWGEYQEGMPSTGFQGFSEPSSTGKNDYVRKHNPLIIYDSVANSTTRSANIKNFTLFDQDLANNTIPQWVFITPNMTNDGHDTNVTFAGSWAKGFLTPLLANPDFNGHKTLILITFDESGSNKVQNRIDGILLGSAVPKSLVGTVDASFYTHYSEIATIEANWNLHTLGRYDVGANVFNFVAKHTGDVVRTNSALETTFLNASYPGVFNTGSKAPLPVPNTRLIVNGRRVHPLVVQTWGAPALQACTTYNGSLVPPSLANPPVLPSGC